MSRSTDELVEHRVPHEDSVPHEDCGLHDRVLSGHRVVLTGGGSGGHVFPAVAIGEELRLRGWRVSFIGTAEGLEARIVPERGLDFHPLRARAVLGRGLLQRIRALLVLVGSTFQARRLLADLGTEVVVATGGYVSVPSALAARTRGIPLVLVEPNRRAGLANRWLSRLAAVAATAHGETAADLRCTSRVTGAPVRRAFFEAASATTAEAEKLDRVTRVLVLGGSQGALALNLSVPEALAVVAEKLARPIRVLHQAGRGKAEEARALYEKQDAKLEAEVVEFVDDVPKAMREADCVLSRSGAITLAEIHAAGRPALLFPLPGAGRHQLQNALFSQSAGAAEVVVDPTPSEIVDRLASMLVAGRLEQMGAAARGLARPRAVREIADMVESLGGTA